MCCTGTVIPEMNETDAFAKRMIGVINDAGLALMISIGHRTGLFDAMSRLTSATSAEIARAAELNERYVREWLGAMTTGDIVSYDARTREYALPAAHASFLTRAAAPNNLAATTQFIGILGGVESRITACFRTGGGVPYAAFEGFHPTMAEESDQSVCAALLDHILPLSPEAVALLEQGVEAADIGCGSGHALVTLASAFPNSTFRGYDFSPDAIDAAQERASAAGVRNVHFEVRDAATLDERSRFGVITAFDAIHDQARPAEVLANIARALRPDGVFLMQDIGGHSDVEHDKHHPMAPFLYTISCMHCMTVSLAAGGAGLGAMWGRETARRMLAEAGFARVDLHELEHDLMNVYFVARVS